MRRIAGIVLAVLLIGGVVAAVVAGSDTGDTGTATKTVRGVIGSEKAEFFADPQVVKALAAKGYTVKTETSGSWAMDGLDLKGYDFAFPSSKAPADELAAKYKVREHLPRPFYSPLVTSGCPPPPGTSPSSPSSSATPTGTNWSTSPR